MAGLSFVHFCLCYYFLPTQIACQMFLEAAWLFSLGITHCWMPTVLFAVKFSNLVRFAIALVTVNQRFMRNFFIFIVKVLSAI